MFGPRDRENNPWHEVDVVFELTNKELCDTFEKIYPTAQYNFSVGADETAYDEVFHIRTPTNKDYFVSTVDVLFEMARRYYNILERVSESSGG